MDFYIRLDEPSKTEDQIIQRKRTYEAARLLRENGFNCRVSELFTGKDAKADAACITLEF